jgi:VIT1/CCC1 family predicted Fe2+/Mn2+ transporter
MAISVDAFVQSIGKSFSDSFGDIVFGMEDGTVSIFGLVFGVAASSTSSSAVLLAGATGAIAAAVSMMAGTYLDVSTTRDQTQVQIAHEKAEIEQKPQEEYQEVTQRLRAAGFTEKDTATVLEVLQHTPNALLRFETAFELQKSTVQQNPWVQATWMFVADLIAASIPVIPFAVLPLASARIISVIVTAILLILLGVGRGIVGKRNVLVTIVETVGIATAAALAGFLIGKLVAG